MAKKRSGLVLSAPKQATWLLAVILGVFGILGSFGFIAAIHSYGTWLLVIGWLLLVLGTLLEGM